MGQLLDLGSLRAKSIETEQKNLHKIYTQSTSLMRLQACGVAGGTPVDNLEYRWSVQVGLMAPDGRSNDHKAKCNPPLSASVWGDPGIIQ